MATFNNGKRISAVINFPQEKTPSPVLEKGVLSRLGNLGSYYTILHDKFSANETEEETIHRHVVIESPVGLSSTAWIASLSMAFDVPLNCVSVEPAKSLKAVLRYLVHKDNEERYQFPVEAVQTNNTKAFKNALNASRDVDMDTLISYMGDWVQFGRDYGVSLMAKYKRTIVELGEIQETRPILTMEDVDRMSSEIDYYRDCYRNLLDSLKEAMARPRNIDRANVPLKELQEILNSTLDFDSRKDRKK